MTDPRIDRLAQVLVSYSTRIREGDRVLIEAQPAAEPLIRALYKQILDAGGHPHMLISLSGMFSHTGLDDVFMANASDTQLDYPSTFYELAYGEFESRIRIHSEDNTKSLTHADQQRLARRRKTLQPVLEKQFTRGEKDDFRWLTTLYPTNAYAQDADMSLSTFEDYVFQACHVDDPDKDPLEYWRQVEKEQDRIVDALNGHERIRVRSPHCDLTLSIKGRSFLNASGKNNMPDGEIFTGPVEDSVSGRVFFTYSSVSDGVEVGGVELTFEEGKVVKATATKNEAYLIQKLDTDGGSRFLGEFAIGLNYGVTQHTKNILFDEKIGGSIHMALGAGYPATGSINESAIHWDFVTDMRDDAEIEVDGEIVYKNGAFTI